MRKFWDMMNKTEMICGVVILLMFAAIVMIRTCVPGAEVFDDQNYLDMKGGIEDEK